MFQKGNKLGQKKGIIDAALRRAVAQDDGERIRKAVENILDKAADGELPAIAWLADRLDGKVAQQIEAVVDANVAFAETVSAADALRNKIRKNDPA